LSIQLIDSFGRTINYLRLSITGRCNLRCLYCMPHGISTRNSCAGEMNDEKNDEISFEELLRICRILSGIGISNVRVTGGEPLLREGAPEFISQLKKIAGIKRLSMTTNGLLLAEHLPALAAAGLDAINISLDTLDAETFRRLTGYAGLEKILSAVDSAVELGLSVKINCVAMKGINENEIPLIAALAKNKKITVCFIELMPLGVASAIKGLPVSGIVSSLEDAFGHLAADAADVQSGPAVYHKLEGFIGRIAIIAAVSQRFCSGCNRLRITAVGELKPCLASPLSIDLRRLVKEACDSEIEQAVRELVLKKPAGHNFGAAAQAQKYSEAEMFRIGG
jgi:cyclic pyranopterin phosphate synthase